MAVAALESLGILFGFADWLKESTPHIGSEVAGAQVSDLVVLLLGVGSAVIDNVPLVAASLGMFSEPADNILWHFIAYSAGTGGSMLIIGSAAGVVAMGMEKINFFWYLKKISWLAFVGFIAGALVFSLQEPYSKHTFSLRTTFNIIYDYTFNYEFEYVSNPIRSPDRT